MFLAEAAVLLDLTTSTLRHQIRNGRLKAQRRGRDWWVTPAEVARYKAEIKGRSPARKKEDAPDGADDVNA